MERPRLRSLDVGCFLSYDYGFVNFGDATFLVGRNGAGKSNFVRAVWMLGRLVREPLSAMLDERGGFESFRHRLLEGARDKSGEINLLTRLSVPDARSCEYDFSLRPLDGGFQVLRETAKCDNAEFHRVGKDWFEPVPDTVPLLHDDVLALPLMAGTAEFAPLINALDSVRFVDIDPDRLRDYQSPDSGFYLRHDGSNAASVLREMVRSHPDRHTRLREFLSAAVPGLVDVQPKFVGSKLSIEFAQSLADGSRILFEAMNMSDGTLRIVGLLIALLQSPSPMMLVIEEPEAAIHPGALAVLLDAMREAKERMQLLVTTQSPEILDADWITEDDVRIVDWQNGFSRIGPLASGAREMLRDHLFTAGELLRSNALVGEPAAP